MEAKVYTKSNNFSEFVNHFFEKGITAKEIWRVWNPQFTVSVLYWYINTPSYLATICFTNNVLVWGQGFLLAFAYQDWSDWSDFGFDGPCLLTVHSKPDGNYEIGYLQSQRQNAGLISRSLISKKWKRYIWMEIFLIPIQYVDNRNDGWQTHAKNWNAWIWNVSYHLQNFCNFKYLLKL